MGTQLQILLKNRKADDSELHTFIKEIGGVQVERESLEDYFPGIFEGEIIEYAFRFEDTGADDGFTLSLTSPTVPTRDCIRDDVEESPEFAKAYNEVLRGDYKSEVGILFGTSDNDNRLSRIKEIAIKLLERFEGGVYRSNGVPLLLTLDDLRDWPIRYLGEG